MIPKTLSELEALIDLLRAKHVAHFEMGDLKLLMGGVPEEEPEAVEEVEQEEVDPNDGLTPSEKAAWYQSSE